MAEQITQDILRNCKTWQDVVEYLATGEVVDLNKPINKAGVSILVGYLQNSGGSKNPVSRIRGAAKKVKLIIT